MVSVSCVDALLIEILGPSRLRYNLYLTACLERRSQKAEWKHKQRKVKKDGEKRKELGETRERERKPVPLMETSRRGSGMQGS